MRRATSLLGQSVRQRGCYQQRSWYSNTSVVNPIPSRGELKKKYPFHSDSTVYKYKATVQPKINISAQLAAYRQKKRERDIERKAKEKVHRKERKIREVILLRDDLRLGFQGDILRVKKGFARNYLLPTKRAVYLTDPEAKSVETEASKATLLQKLENERVRKQFKRLTRITLLIPRIVTTKKLSAPITKGEIITALYNKHKIILYPHQILNIGQKEPTPADSTTGVSEVVDLDTVVIDNKALNRALSALDSDSDESSTSAFGTSSSAAPKLKDLVIPVRLSISNTELILRIKVI
eukprot:TRINITY_DN2449_c0_g1_i1.p1 TRINITY_DN2449_c0_g1~~TRINITY_DN2449_c0_g1_i1.p1  ORF type:complete len:295 (-),score=62.96 TRINITY_DN2449_c0_g1_i1:57-941(-)